MTELRPGRPPQHRLPRSRRSRAAATAVAVLALAGGLLASGNGPAQATTSSPLAAGAATVTSATASRLTAEQQLASWVNAARRDNGRKPYAVAPGLSSIAEAQAKRMASKQKLYHNPNLTTEVHYWSALGENVAYASSLLGAHKALMSSAPHRANILSRTFTSIGVGVVKDSHGRYWVCEVFRKV